MTQCYSCGAASRQKKAIGRCQRVSSMQMKTQPVRLLDVFANPGDATADIMIAYGADVVGGQLAAADDALEAVFFTADALPPTSFMTTKWLIERWLANRRPAIYNLNDCHSLKAKS